jgi:glycosyltransferase involved in cell wall biosynthesis
MAAEYYTKRRLYSIRRDYPTQTPAAFSIMHFNTFWHPIRVKSFMRLLIWCPHVNLGGGKRLLARLTHALAEQPAITHIRLVMPVAADLGFQHPKVEFVRLTPAQAGGWLEKERWRSDSNPLHILRSRARYLRYQMTAPGLFHSLEHDMDVVYVFWPHGVPYYPFLKPVVCTFQDATLLDFPEILGGRGTTLERERTNDWLAHSRTVVVSSDHTRQRLQYHFANMPIVTALIFHNILLDEILANVTPPLTAKFANLPAHFILYPANINAHKNHENLLVAWSRFARRQEYPLVLVGEGVEVMGSEHPLAANRYWRQDVLKGSVTRLGLLPGRDIYTYGYVTDAELNAIQQRAIATVMPSLSEGGGSYPVEESLAVGVPVLCADIPVMRETLINRDAAVLWFDPYSPNHMVEGLNKLLDDYPHYKQAAEAGQSATRPSWSDIAAQYTAVFEAAVKG